MREDKVPELNAEQLEREYRSQLVAEFADELSARLGRSAEELRQHGLRAGDFPLDGIVEVTFEDGSFMSLHYAFALVNQAQRVVGVFSEHCGYFCVPACCLQVRQLAGSVVVEAFRFDEKGGAAEGD